ncbi:hypothetical protein BDZ97DRAFT_999356 [Flammula alnicola]|nr:hypothetical protein BDZ97DRAFT_999356 [Flammula alnicola]
MSTDAGRRFEHIWSPSCMTLTTMATGPLFSNFRLLPELFPLIASHLPLHATPSTLLALALANHAFYDIVQPLLFSCLVLKNENDALAVIERLLDDPQLGRNVRELYVMSDLSPATRAGDNPFDVVTGFRKVIEGGLLPRLYTFGFYLLQHWYKDENRDDVLGYGHFPAEFWTNIRINCPACVGLFCETSETVRVIPGLRLLASMI